ncbi:MAG: hypothetical protein IT267_09160 [Saprospiraceae bacterium]|nr:hypothetical protein [Saprospiraceae bacterium]
MLATKDIKWIKRLHEKEARYELGYYLAEGSKLVLDLIKHNPRTIYKIFGTTSWIIQNEAKIRENELNYNIISESQLSSITSLKSTKHVLAVVQFNHIELSSISRLPKNLYYLYQVQDPGNLGTLIRTADWFGINTLLLSEHCADPYNNKCVQASMSSIARVNLIQMDFKRIKSHFTDYTLVSTTTTGMDYKELNNASKFIFCLGNEAHGLPPELIEVCDFNVSIKSNSLGSESLNVSICGGILMSFFNI